MSSGGQSLAGIVPSCSVKTNKDNGQETWRKLLDVSGSGNGGQRGSRQGIMPLETRGSLPGVVERSPKAPTSPPAGVFGIHSPDFDDNSTEGKIARLEKRLKRNLPPEVRAQLEQELEILQCFKSEMEAIEKQEKRNTPPLPPPPKNTRGVRRKVGIDVSPPEQQQEVVQEDDEYVVIKKKVNTAAPVMTHPHTMARMKDWQQELDRRLKEQQEIDGTSPKSSTKPTRNSTGGDAFADNPLGKIQEAVESLFEGVAGALGLGAKEEVVVTPSKSTLPPQTFSRRL